LKNQKHFGWLAVTVLILSFSFFLSGCWDTHELNKLAIVSGLGFDIDPETSEHILTVQSIIPSKVKSSSAGSSGEQVGGSGTVPAVQLDHIKGRTALDALGTYSTQGNRALFFPHNQIVIIGKAVAQQGVYPVIEQLLRFTQSRPNRMIMIAQDKASDVLAARDGMEVIPGMGLAGEVRLSAEFSKYPAISLLEFGNRLMSQTTAPIFPIISTFEETGPGGQKFNKVRIMGTAVFKRDKMIGELNERESRGLLWVTNKVKRGFVVVDAPDGSGQASLGITRAKSEIIPEVNDGKVAIRVVIEEQADLTEYQGRKHIDDTLLKQFEESQAKVIRKDVMAAFNKSLVLNADVFGFGEAVHRKYKNDWRDMASQWDEIYPDIDIAIQVKTNINETGDISKAVIPQ